MNEQQLIALVSELKPSCTADELTTVENITNYILANPGKKNPISGIGKRELVAFLEYVLNFWFEKKRVSKDILSANNIQFNQFRQAKEILFELLDLGVWDSRYLPKTYHEAVLGRFKPDRRELLDIIAFTYLSDVKKRSLQEFINFWNSIHFLMVPNRCILFTKLDLLEHEDPTLLQEVGDASSQKVPECGSKAGAIQKVEDSETDSNAGNTDDDDDHDDHDDGGEHISTLDDLPAEIRARVEFDLMKQNGFTVIKFDDTDYEFKGEKGAKTNPRTLKPSAAFVFKVRFRRGNYWIKIALRDTDALDDLHDALVKHLHWDIDKVYAFFLGNKVHWYKDPHAGMFRSTKWPQYLEHPAFLSSEGFAAGIHDLAEDIYHSTSVILRSMHLVKKAKMIFVSKFEVNPDYIIYHEFSISLDKICDANAFPNYPRIIDENGKYPLQDPGDAMFYEYDDDEEEEDE